MRTQVLSAIAAAVLLLSACGQDDSAESTPSAPPSVSAEDAKSTSLDDVSVEGAFGEKPTVTFESPLVVEENSNKTVVEGQGKQIADGDRVTAEMTLYSGTSGKLIESSYDTKTPASIMMNLPGDISQEFYDVLIESKVGSRILISMNGSLQSGQPTETLVYVFDITNTEQPLTRAEGEKLDQSGNPVEVTWADNGEPAISEPEGEAPTELEAYTTIEGEGPEVKEGQKVAVHYSGWLWDDTSKRFDSSWQDGREPFVVEPIGQAPVIDGWNEGLIGQKVGSQVVLVVPPDKGYGEQGNPPSIPGNAPLIFVVDILSAVG